MKCFRNVKTKEIVDEDDAEEYVLDILGINITPQGKNGEMTQEQLDFIESTVEWFFSGEWYRDDIKDEEEVSIAQLINEHCYYDNLYLKERGID